MSASRYQPVELLEMRRRWCFVRRAGLEVGVLGGVGVVDVLVGEEESSGCLVFEFDLLFGFLSVMVRAAARLPVRMRDVVFIFFLRVNGGQCQQRVEFGCWLVWYERFSIRLLTAAD